jgi:hypothetical protein
MSPASTRLVLAALFAFAPACAATPAPTAESTPEHHHDHELHLPPVGPSVTASLDGKPLEVVLGNVAHDGPSASLVQVWKSAFPSEDPTALHFDLVGSDGFHPGSRPACARLLTGAEMAIARIDLVTHNVTFGGDSSLPGCYRVKAVVRIDASR